MKDKYLICVKTDKSLGDRAFVESFLKGWLSGVSQELRPERFDFGEPIRRKVAEEGIESVIDAWLNGPAPMMFKRVSKPKFVVDTSWRRHKGLDPRQFPWHCTVWLDFSAGDVLALELFRFLIAHFEPGFGWATSYLDEREKHFITFMDRIGQVETFAGLDPGKALPGIYWATYFGRWAVAKVGAEKFDSLNAYRVERYCDGILVLAYPSCRLAGSPEARQAEEKIKEHLGRELFFDKSKVDIESLKTRPEDAAVIEAKIAEVKKRRAQR
ncbi:MAG: hypothetical protein N2379_10095 [Verrucomicrobiae bacterium]|nr:hypothetical protein [Verrucomicrobiae bacterium]